MMLFRSSNFGFSLRFLNLFFLLVFFPFMAFAADSIFVPKPPEKPLRFCKATSLFLKSIESDSSFVEITRWRDVKFDLRYASFNNVTGHDLYCGSKRAFLHRDAAEKFRKAIHLLKKKYPDYHFVIFDVTRPLYAQEALRALVRGTPFSHYVTSPASGSIHNFGLAIDLSIADSTGNLLDMGTDFDSFEPCAGKQGEAEALKQGRLNQEQIKNRNLLRQVMIQAGFISLPSEWWHFNAYLSKEVRANYTKVSF
jgi:D-alanyl-D-alanine dipeptidase